MTNKYNKNFFGENYFFEYKSIFKKLLSISEFKTLYKKLEDPRMMNNIINFNDFTEYERKRIKSKLELKTEDNVVQLKTIEFTNDELKDIGYTRDELIKGGYTDEEITKIMTN